MRASMIAWALQATDGLSWMQVVQTLGLAFNATLTAYLVRARNTADEVQAARFYDLMGRLKRIERRCYGPMSDDMDHED